MSITGAVASAINSKQQSATEAVARVAEATQITINSSSSPSSKQQSTVMVEVTATKAAAG